MSQQCFVPALPTAVAHTRPPGLAETRNIERGAILNIPQPDGARIECLAGTLWVTQDNDPRDILLEPGEDCQLSGRGRVLVQALETSRLRVWGGQTW